ncbi:hypothetical protein TPHA_0D02340 [Tetrapisispora phaffii CBS 4417]|uniref:BZIP domain-containing protein n=1 Tax=Tetrapisispora phaffii (strain ATCC 24235 / CBS 4417 / NBRC 1672 / NRRL Y-8282 / UCD 70-5) TaxID=1071381 RepID=G8BSQ0_TETPH|nr:hypothetical protein TPHA_0D02340 [Tetrapisispora phaffii CBS 4417]CCE62871.1 hypothetical protein TPHA_0D02340 [Tetrapisispora phaffii CBS 4417]
MEEYLDTGKDKEQNNADYRMKRIAQNRAAQKAFRERKEKKMKELQEKVRKLENINEKNEIETVFLRTQLLSLVNELKKYRIDKNDDFRLKKIGSQLKHEKLNLNKLTKSSSSSSRLSSLMEDLNSNKIDTITKTLTNSSFASMNGSTHSPTSDFAINNIDIVSPHSASGSFTNQTTAGTSYSHFSSELNSPTSVSNYFAGNAGTTWPEAFSMTDLMVNSGHMMGGSANNQQSNINSLSVTMDDEKVSSLVDEKSSILQQDSNLFSTEFDFANEFDEQVSTFCAKMNKTFENRKEMIKQFYTEKVRNSNNKPRTVSIKQEPTTTLQANIQPSDSNDVTESLVAASIAFPEQYNMVKSDSLYNFLKQNNNNIGYGDVRGNISTQPNSIMTNNLSNNEQNYNFSKDAQFIVSQQNTVRNIQTANEYPNIYETDDSSDGGDEVVGQIVPLTDGRLLECGEIWDRITTYPRYSDIDIDGLCEELMASAKCSDKGVLVSSDDVQKVLSRRLV